MIEPATSADLEDHIVIAAMRDYLKHKKAPDFSKYKFMRLDLDDDGLRDAIVYITAPYGQWCTDDGCTILVFHAENSGFTLAGELFPVRPPLYASESTTNRWHDLIIRVSGREKEKTKDVLIQYDGENYLFSPEKLDAIDKRNHPILIKAFP